MKEEASIIHNAVVFFCHDGEGNFLFNLRGENCRDEHGHWDPGGGAIEIGETVEEALFREILQEYCASVFSVNFLGYRDVFRENENGALHWIAFDFLVHIDRSTVKNGEPHKLKEINWFTLDSLPHPLHSQYMIAYQKYHADFMKVGKL